MPVPGKCLGRVGNLSLPERNPVVDVPGHIDGCRPERIVRHQFVEGIFRGDLKDNLIPLLVFFRVDQCRLILSSGNT